MSSCVLLYSCFGQLIKDQPHLFVFEPHGLDRPIGFNWLRIHQGIEDFGLAVRSDRPITVEGCLSWGWSGQNSGCRPSTLPASGIFSRRTRPGCAENYADCNWGAPPVRMLA